MAVTEAVEVVAVGDVVVVAAVEVVAVGDVVVAVVEAAVAGVVVIATRST